MKMSLHKRKMTNLVEMQYFKSRVCFCVCLFVFSCFGLLFISDFEVNTSLFGFKLVTFNVLEKIENSWSETEEGKEG